MAITPSVSIIVPVVNEADILAGTLLHLSALGADEVIVVDGASDDATEDLICQGFPWVRYFRVPYRNRARQMNLGAREAVAEVFLFVHADMELPANAIPLIRRAIGGGGCVGGGFEKTYRPAGLFLTAYSFCLNKICLRVFKFLVGTNAIFMSRRCFERLEGYPIVPFLEDWILGRDLRRLGCLAFFRQKARVSPRRYLRVGILRQILINARIVFGFFFAKKDPAALRMLYDPQLRLVDKNTEKINSERER